MKKLSPNGLGLSLGILCGLCMLIMSLLALGGLYTAAYEVMIAFHVFADLTIAGIIFGILEAGITGYVFGALLAWLYNRFA